MINKIRKHPIFVIFIIFLIWRILLIFVNVYAESNIPLGNKDRFLGGGALNYLHAPRFFSWANYDGEHYLSISIYGYKFLEQAFFPVYPMLISFFSKPFGTNLSPLVSSALVGLLISNIATFFALVFLWELIREDYSEKFAYLTIILLLIFPTSFYLGAVYNESLYLLFSVLAFYFIRKNMWVKSTFFGIIASATRIFGLFLLPSFLFEAWIQKKNLSKTFWIIFIPLGLGLYMLYQYLTVRDPLAFYHLQKIVGEQHQSGFTLLPQVYFRYIKMIFTVNIHNPIYPTLLLEFFVGIIFFLLPIYGYFKKIRFSYLIYAILGFLTPTIQGSFSSVPRYVLAFFPSFIALALLLDKSPKIFRFIYLLGSLTLLCFETTLFSRGYWVA